MWILILFAHVGAMGQGNSNAITTTQFSSQQRCEAAGAAAKKLVSGTVKQMEFVCVPQ